MKKGKILREWKDGGLTFQVSDNGNVYITYYNSCQDWWGYESEVEISCAKLFDFLIGWDDEKVDKPLDKEP
jgi:hypothetical protein